MTTLEEAFAAEVEEGEDTVNKTKAYVILCAAGFIPTSLDIAKYWKAHEKADDDHVTLDEIKELSEQLGDPAEVLREAFKYFDKDGNGKICRDELKEILKYADVNGSETYLDDEYIDQTLALGNTDTTGEEPDNPMLDINELIAMLTEGILKFE